MSSLGLSRQQLAQFLTDPAAIKAFENLFTQVIEVLPSTTDDSQVSADAARVQAAEALSGLASVANDLAMLLGAPPLVLNVPDVDVPPMVALQAPDVDVPPPLVQTVADVYVPPAGDLGTMASQNASKVAITGGAIDGTPVGQTTRAAGSFTTVNANDTILSTGGKGVGYGTGSGGQVTQATDKGTAVTLNSPSGKITMNSAALAAGAVVGFVCNNSAITSTDTVNANIIGGPASIYNYQLWAIPGGGAITFYLKNLSAGSLSEAIVINFSLIKGATS